MKWKSEAGGWDAAELLKAIVRNDLRLSDAQRDEWEPVLWNDLCSEHDSRYLNEELQTRAAQWSPEFKSFWSAWYLDERNHYVGFRRIYSLVYGESEASIEKRAGSRAPNFDRLAPFLRQEFETCLLIAYDEIATTKSYASDFPFYKSLGPTQLADWGRLLTADEARHFLNLLNICRFCFQDRLGDARDVLAAIFAVDRERKYEATFVLDHEGSAFSDDMLLDCIGRILKDLAKPGKRVAVQ